MSTLKQRESTILEAALKLSPKDAAAYLDEACGGDALLRQRIVAALFEAHENAGATLQASAPPAPEETTVLSLPLSEKPGDHIGHYKLLEQIGEGGFGVVYVAEQQEPVRRQVALKIIKLGMDTRQVVARFEAERQALALMDHPNVAKVFDAGATDSGRPFFVMELVKGISIIKYCDQEKLSTGDRLKLFIGVCQAIQHAHQKGIIHRDIKPSNILVTLQEGTPVPKVIDFGIAKATQQKLTDKTLHTLLEQFIGTPAYMSPEQAEMSGLDIDTRSDIYSLGVLLYELLVGETPFDSKELLAAGLDEIRRTIREKEPARPSTRLSLMGKEELTTTTQRRGAEAPKLIGLLRGDLDWIVMKCLEKDRTRRYDTANALAADLKRHLDNEPVVARPPSTAYRLQKAWRRNKLAFTAAAVMAMSLVVGIGVSSWQAIVASKARNAEKQQRLAAQTERDRAERALYVANLNLAQQALEAGNLDRARELLEMHLPQPGRPDLRGFEWRHFWKRSQAVSRTILRGHRSQIFGVAFSPDGKQLATASLDRTVKLWDVQTGREVTTLSSHRGAVRKVAFSPDGRTLVTGGVDKTMRFWNTTSWQEVATLPAHKAPFDDLEFSPDGTLIATASDDGTVKLWDPIQHTEVATLRGHTDEVWRVAFAPHVPLLASGSKDKTIRLWDLASRREAGAFVAHDHGVSALAFSPDGKLLVSGSVMEGPVKVWDATTRKLVLMLKGHTAGIYWLAFSPDGKVLATASDDKSIKLWEMPSGRELSTLRGHAFGVWIVAFSPDGSKLASGAGDSVAILWDLNPKPEKTILETAPGRFFWGAAFSPDGRTLGTMESESVLGSSPTIKLWEVARFQVTTELQLTNTHVHYASFSPDSRVLGICDSGGIIRLWDIKSRRETAAFDSTIGIPLGVRFSPDNTSIAVWGRESTVRLFDSQSHRQVGVLAACDTNNPQGVWMVGYSPDGHRLATLGIGEKAVRLWDVASQRLITTIGGKNYGYILCLSFSPQGPYLATGGQDTNIRLWNWTEGRELAAFKGHAAPISSVSFSSDGKTLSSGSVDGIVKLWSVALRAEVATLKGHSAEINSLAFSPDGNLFVTGARENRIRLWHAVPFTETDSSAVSLLSAPP